MSSQKNLIPISGTETAVRSRDRVIGEVDPNERIEVTVRVRCKTSGPGIAALETMVLKLGSQKPAKRSYLTHKEYEAAYGADPADLDKIRAYAKAQGLDVLDSNAARRTVELAGPAGKLAAAFGAKLELCKHEGQMVRRRVGTLAVPGDLAGVIEGVFGFDNHRMAEPQLRRRRVHGVAHAENGAFTPLEVAQLYNFPKGLDGQNQCIGILEFGGGFETSDLKTYFDGLGLAVPQVVAIPVGQGQNNPGQDPDSDGEVMLDIEVAGAVAPKAKIAVYFSTFTVKGWVDALTRAVHDTDNRPSVISVSWGFAEQEPLSTPGSPPFLWSQSAVDAVNQALLAAASMGVTVTVASGDDGSSDQFNDGQAHVDFPSSSPYVLSCGGTKLVGSGRTITSEVVWNEEKNGEGATGGGISDLNPLPSYQTNPPVSPSVNKGHHVGRGIPDVAGNADPETGFQTLADGHAGVTGGTSAVAPLWAGLIALLNQGLGKNVGFFNPLLYQEIGPKGTLNDIVTGDNGAYKAKPGWDPCTGWGSPNGQTLLDALKS